MAIRISVNDDIAYEGEPIPVPRVGDHLRRDDEVFQIESVTWDLNGSTVAVNLLVGSQPYTF
jgi:hypothetical protein